jgi:nuclease-like protein
MDTFFLVQVAYMAIFVATIVVMALWDKKRRRKPFREDIRLLRMPGEHLWREVIKHDENEFIWFLGLGIAPIIIIGLVLPFLSALLSHPARDIVVCAVVLCALLVCARAFYKRLNRRANYYLGFFGERYVGEILEPLKSKGWYIFHDVPCVGGSAKFNLDHIVVGTAGVWVVETKTFRKRGTRGKKEATVNYDGETIGWPWGAEWDSIEQAAGNVRYLRDWLEKQTGKIYPVAGVLTAPGYCVVEKRLGAVRMVNPNGLVDVVQSRKDMALSPEDVDLIRRQLETKCRDIEY